MNNFSECIIKFRLKQFHNELLMLHYLQTESLNSNNYEAGFILTVIF